jgi:hypothetical protein
MKCFVIYVLFSIILGYLTFSASCVYQKKGNMGLEETWNRLSALEKQVINYLLTDWQKPYRSTNVEQAMRALGLEFSDTMRKNIAKYLEAAYKDPDCDTAKCYQRLKMWGPLPFILTNHEKLIGRYLAMTKEVRGILELATALEIPRREVQQGLGMLKDIGFLMEASSLPPGYILSDKYEDFLAWKNPSGNPALGFTFHAVTIKGEPEFNVQCTVDFLLLALNNYKGKMASLEERCIHCIDPIRIQFDQGKLVLLEPESAVLFFDQSATCGCGAMNAFSSEKHYNQWKKEHPGVFKQFKKPTLVPLRDKDRIEKLFKRY